MKQLLLICLFVVSIFANDDTFVEPDKAFIVSSIEYKDKVTLKIDLAKDIYLYDEALKVLINSKDITKQLTLPKPINYHDFIVHFNSVSIDIPRDLISGKVTLRYQGCSTAGLCYSPEKKEFSFLVKETKNETDVIADTLKEGNILLILATFFGFGLLLALTPCIFPMIPILSSVIVTHSKHGDMSSISASKGFYLSLIYVLSMSSAYTIAGVFAGMFGANIQAMLQNPIVIIVFASIFVLLALSMFGYFKLELPHHFQNRVHQTSRIKSKNGVLGVAIMGFLSALIVGPCVAPPLAGALVYIGQTGDAFLGGLALFVMSFGMGLPLLAVGAGAGKFMPKPGGWMDKVSKIFGIIMLGIAIYMLDRIVEPSTISILWFLLSTGTLIYLIKIKNIVSYISSILLLFVSIHLLLNIIVGTKHTNHVEFKYIKTVSELEYELNNTNKPIMLDFWASWCVSCKELEEITFASKDVQNILKDYKLLKIDMSENSADDKLLQKNFNIFGPPALIFFNKNGKEINSKKIVGYKDPKEFLKIVK